jgi:O-antigen/teichoic acid export membrane protein
MIARFLKDGAIYAISGIITRGLSFFLLPLYTRLLAPSDYGALDMLLTFGAFIHLTVALEISQGMARYYGESKDEQDRVGYGSTAFWFTLAAYNVFLIAALVFADALSLWVMGKQGLENVFRIGLFNLWINGLFNILQNQFRWSLRSRFYAISSLIAAVVSTLATFLLAYKFEQGLYGIVSALAVGALAGCCYALPHLRDSVKFRFDTARLKRMLRFSLPLVPSGIAVFAAYYIDRIMIRHFMTLADVGIYGIAFRIASITSLIMVGFQMSLTPLVMAHHREKETPGHIATIFRIFVAFSLVLFLGLGLFAKETLWLMATPDYYGAAPVVAFLAPAILLSNMYIFAPGTTIANKTHYILYINLAGAALNILLNLFLIPQYGIFGACTATLINYACVFAAYTVLGQRLYRIPYEWAAILRVMLISAVLVTAGLYIDWSPLAVIIAKIALFVTGCACIFLFKLITPQEMRSAKALSCKAVSNTPETEIL